MMKLAASREIQNFAYSKTRTRTICAETAQKVGALVFTTHTWSNPSSTNLKKFNLLAFFCGYVGRSVSALVGDPVERFSRVAAELYLLWFVYTY